mmetsp:Transcript_2192/g.3503  ORF Transcript_2192/g.3503 Transcript_2192/m.3503 type:complete len:82 (-) Transcript_2192:832-1077(-)
MHAVDSLVSQLLLLPQKKTKKCVPNHTQRKYVHNAILVVRLDRHRWKQNDSVWCMRVNLIEERVDPMTELAYNPAVTAFVI